MVRVSNRLPSLETLRAERDEPSSGCGIGGGRGSSLPPPPTLREREREDAEKYL